MPENDHVENVIRDLSRAGYGAGHTWGNDDVKAGLVPAEFVGRTVREVVELLGAKRRQELHAAIMERKDAEPEPPPEADTLADGDLLSFAVEVTIRHLETLPMGRLNFAEARELSGRITDSMLKTVRSADVTVSDAEADAAYMAILAAVEAKTAASPAAAKPPSVSESPTLDTGSPMQ